VSETKTKMGDRAFQVAGPRTWNYSGLQNFPAFKKQLKLQAYLGYLIGNPEH